MLKAEGAIVGNFIKDGRYTVTGEQHYNPKSREWKKASWSVDVANDLANPAGVTVAHAKGKMLVESLPLADAPPPDATGNPDRARPEHLIGRTQHVARSGAAFHPVVARTFAIARFLVTIFARPGHSCL